MPNEFMNALARALEQGDNFYDALNMKMMERIRQATGSPYNVDRFGTLVGTAYGGFPQEEGRSVSWPANVGEETFTDLLMRRSPGPSAAYMDPDFEAIAPLAQYQGRFPRELMDEVVLPVRRRRF